MAFTHNHLYGNLNFNVPQIIIFRFYFNSNELSELIQITYSSRNYYFIKPLSGFFAKSTS